MELTYRFADLNDLDTLTASRVEVLRAANLLADDTDMSEVERESRAYYQAALADGSHIAVLVFDGETLAGTGAVSLFRVMPTYHNPSGRKAYIMNMYTSPAYRRRGIALHTLDLLVQQVKAMGITHITLEATAMGRPLYEKYGFTAMRDEMELPS